MSEHTITELLSPAFLSRMQNMLGDEYESFLKSYEAPRTYGLRVNTAKISCDEFERIVPFPVTPIPWISNGYFYPEDVRPSFCPLYQAGLFYLQEPSAMTPASCLPVTPGENVLDLCAAPGGKATALGAMLNGSGLLVANDITANIFLNFSIRFCLMHLAPEKACFAKKKRLHVTGLLKSLMNFPVCKKN